MMNPSSTTRFSLRLASSIVTVISTLVFNNAAQAASGSWSGASSGAWLTGTNWSATPGSQSTTTNADIATFNVATQPTVGLNFNFAGNTYYLGAIDCTNSTARNIGNSSATGGILQLNGATVNSVANTILRNSSTGLLNLQATQAGTMDVALGNATNNIVQITNSGDITIDGNISGVGRRLTLQGGGSGTLTLGGANTYTGNTTVTSGTLNITGTYTGNTNSSTLALGTAAANTVVNVSNDMTFFALTGANIAGSATAYNQTAGTVNISSTTLASSYVANVGYGYFNLTGGTFKSNGGFSIGSSGSPTSTAVAYVGGTGSLDWSGANNQTVAYTAPASLTVGPGGSISRGASAATTWLATNSGSTAIINVAGGNLDLGTGGSLRVNNTASGGTSITFNVAAGTLTMGKVLSTNGSTNGTLYANYAGGTLKASAALTSPMNALTSLSTVFGAIDNAGTSQDFTGGLTVDTNGFNMTYGNALHGASGNGVKPTDLTVTAGNGYIGAPLVQFTGGTLAPNGTPASGYALMSGGAVTGIVITSPGCYTAAPTVSLTGGGGSGASVSLGALSANAADSGLTKTGSGTLTLSGANTYNGGTSIQAGTLALGASNVLPSTPVSIGGASLNTATFTDTLGTLDVTGNASIILGSGAALTFSNSSAVDWTGGTLTITGTFVSGNSLRFGTSSNGLTPEQLALISIPSGTAAVLDSNGFLIDTLNSPYISGFQSSAPFVQRPVTPTLSWSIGGAITSLTITPDIGDVLSLTSGGTGSVAITPPLGERTYTLTLNGTVTRSVSVVSLPLKEKLHIYLLMGQSNMQGIGAPYSSTLDAAVPRVVKFGSRNGMESVWVKGGHSLTALASNGGSVGMGLEFAKTMLAANSDPEVVIGLINHGLGSTKIEWWAPGAIDDQQVNPVTNQNYRLYDEAIQRVTAALAYGVLKGVLWHQGESNSGTQVAADAYAGQLQDLVSNVRSSFNQPNLPFVCGKFVPATWTYADGSPGAFTGLPFRAITEAALMNLPNQRAHTFCVDNNGLRGRSDELIHFDAYSQRLFGQRYAAGMLGIQTAANNVPVSSPQNVSTAEDTAKAITLATTDADNDPLSYSIVTQPAHGALSGTPPNMTYIPAADFNGPDSFTFRASDGISTSPPATVFIAVTPVNDAPVLAAIPPKTANEGVLLTFTATATDIDLPANILTYSLVNAPNGAAVDPNAGTFIWTPTATQGPGDYDFIMRVSDGNLTHDQSVSVTVAGVTGNPGDDTDGDDLANLIEYGFGTSQTAQSSFDRLPVATVTNGTLEVTYRRPANGGTPGVSYSLQTHTGLAGIWTTAVAGADYTQSIATSGDGTETVTATFVNLPAPGERFFVRLSVSIP